MATPSSSRSFRVTTSGKCFPNYPLTSHICSVRSEEPPGRSIVVQVKQNLKNFGSNLKTSFRNLVGFHRNSSSSSLSNSSMEFFARAPSNQKYTMDNSTTSLNMAASPVADPLVRSEPCRVSTNRYVFLINFWLFWKFLVPTTVPTSLRHAVTSNSITHRRPSLMQWA